MKQTLTELAEILRAVDAGAEWEYDVPGMGWHKHDDQGERTLFQLASYGWAIRLKPGQSPDPHPNRAEVEEGIAQGRKWQCRIKSHPELYMWSVSHGEPQHPAWRPEYEYRLAPEPEYIPLGPEDVPPGSALRKIGCSKTWSLVTGTADSGTICRRGYITEWRILEKEYQINRSLPLTGKWDPTAWEPCRKLKGGSDE